MESVDKYQIKALKKQIFISNLKAWIIGVILIAELLFIGLYLTKSGLLGGMTSPGGNKVAVIHYDKEVTEPYTAKIMEKLESIRRDNSYKAVLFIMSSPGGSPAASEELSAYLRAFQEDKNITMYIESIAASGGYYIASAIRPLIANKNAIVGSIGVIMPHYNLEELAKKVGVSEDYLAAGKFKKPISMFKEIDEENRNYMIEHLLKPTYENFINTVALNRGLKPSQIRPFADGKIYIANAPQIRGILVDEISTLYRVRAKIRKALGGKQVAFVPVSVEKTVPFLPKLKLDLDLSLLLEQWREAKEKLSFH